MKKAVFWDEAQCRNGVNRRFEGTYFFNFKEICDNNNKEICEVTLSFSELSD
jgi:hypothetical protein